MNRYLFSAFFALFVSINAPISGIAQDSSGTLPPKVDFESQKANGSYAAGWSLQCLAKTKDVLDCEITNTIFSTPSKQRFIVVTISKNAGDPIKGRGQIQVVLPHGVNLETGVNFFIDDGARLPLTPVTSDATGLFEKIVIDDATIKLLKKSKQTMVTFSGLDGKTYSVKLDSVGLPVLLNASGLIEK